MAVTVLALAGCAFGPVDGEDVARDIAKEAAKRLNDDLGYRSRIRDAESIAATEVPTEAPTEYGTGSELRVTPLAWSGQTIRAEKATVDVRFAATVPQEDASSIGGRSHTAGDAALCFRYTLQLYRYTSYREIRCRRNATPPVPSASPVLTLPPDAKDRLAAALRGATPETLAGAVRAAFPQPVIGVDTVTHQGTLVAAVGVARERDCVVMIRTPNGETKEVGYDPTQLEPGETGCGTSLYTNPPR